MIDRAMLRYPWMRSVLLRNLADVALPDRPFDRRARRPAGVASLTDLIDANARRAPVFVSRLNADEDRAWTQRYDSWPYVELARDVLESLAASHPDPPAGLFKNAGLAYQQLARFDPTRVDGMVR